MFYPLTCVKATNPHRTARPLRVKLCSESMAELTVFADVSNVVHSPPTIRSSLQPGLPPTPVQMCQIVAAAAAAVSPINRKCSRGVSVLFQRCVSAAPPWLPAPRCTKTLCYGPAWRLALRCFNPCYRNFHAFSLAFFFCIHLLFPFNLSGRQYGRLCTFYSCYRLCLATFSLYFILKN